MQTKPSKDNKRPDAISHHTSVVYGERMYMFGGSKASGQENSAFFALNIEKVTWQMIVPVSNITIIINLNLYRNLVNIGLRVVMSIQHVSMTVTW